MLNEKDHRHIANRMNLLHFQEEAPGMVFWHPPGYELYRQLEGAARRQIQRQGYQEVRTPQLLRNAIWESSGHLEHFVDSMFRVHEDGRDAALKPVSCPGHVQIAAHRLESYRDLPIKFAEFGIVHRNERSGSLHGFFRLRQFTQDDGHIFCEPNDVVDEVRAFCESLVAFYKALGIESYEVSLSLRPASRFGADEDWDRAESALARGLDEAGIDYEEHAGEGAFYGPKIEFLLRDHASRLWQCGTIQLDFFMPERFGLSYVDEDDNLQRPAMLHRALFGSLERFMGVLLEQNAGHLPVWLAPIQACVLPVGEDHSEYAAMLHQRLAECDVRVEVAAPDSSLGRRIAQAHERGIPLMLIVGAREIDEQSVSLRSSDGQSALGLDAALEEVSRLASPPV